MIDRPAEEVFAFVSDPTHDPQWHATVLEVTPTSERPLRGGSTFTDRAFHLAVPADPPNAEPAPLQ
jgi:uncharacterized protein YndB with AHSA1/START domain